MDQQQEPRWQPTRKQLLWAAGAAVGLLTIAILIGYRYDITLWDWIKLLIVPAVIAGGGFWFNRQQRERELEIAERRTQDEALQAYLDQIGQMLLVTNRPLRRSKHNAAARTLARAQTLTVLTRLNGVRRGSFVQFLYEAALLRKEGLVVDLMGANLREADLSGRALIRAKLIGTKLIDANLHGADLGEAELSHAHLHNAKLIDANLIGADLTLADLSSAKLNEAGLRRADLSYANLSNANLVGADLSNANLVGAKLIEADLTLANLSGATLLEADLSRAILGKANLGKANLVGAVLSKANLTKADLHEADLHGADLVRADLRQAGGVTNDQLKYQAESLERATMPNGQKYEDWLKGKVGREKDGQNGGSS